MEKNLNCEKNRILHLIKRKTANTINLLTTPKTFFHQTQSFNQVANSYREASLKIQKPKQALNNINTTQSRQSNNISANSNQHSQISYSKITHSTINSFSLLNHAPPKKISVRNTLSQKKEKYSTMKLFSFKHLKVKSRNKIKSNVVNQLYYKIGAIYRKKADNNKKPIHTEHIWDSQNSSKNKIKKSYNNNNINSIKQKKLMLIKKNTDIIIKNKIDNKKTQSPKQVESKQIININKKKSPIKFNLISLIQENKNNLLKERLKNKGNVGNQLNEDSNDIGHILNNKKQEDKTKRYLEFDNFDELNSIIRAIQFEKINVIQRNIFSIDDNPTYEQYIVDFEDKFSKLFFRKKKKEKKISISTYSTHENSSKKNEQTNKFL